MPQNYPRRGSSPKVGEDYATERYGCDCKHDGIAEEPRHLFTWMRSSIEFRRQVKGVTKENSDGVRVGVTDAMLMAAAQFNVHPDCVKYYSGKSKGVHQRDYQATTLPEFGLLIEAVNGRHPLRA